MSTAIKMTEAAAVPSLQSLFKKKSKKTGAKSRNFNTDSKTIQDREAEALAKKKEKEQAIQAKEDEKKWQDDKIETKQLRVGTELGQIEKEEVEESGPTTMGWNKSAMKDAPADAKSTRQFPKLSGESRMVVLHGEKTENKIKVQRNRFANFGESDDEDNGPVMTRKKRGEMIKREDSKDDDDVDPRQKKEDAKKAALAKEKRDEAQAKKDLAKDRIEKAPEKEDTDAKETQAPAKPKCDIKADSEAIYAKFEERRKLPPVDLPDSEVY